MIIDVFGNNFDLNRQKKCDKMYGEGRREYGQIKRI